MAIPRVLHISPFVGISGAPMSMVTLASELSRRGETYAFLPVKDEIAMRAIQHGVQVTVVSENGKLPKSRWKRLPMALSRLVRTIRRHRIELMHCHSAAANHWAVPAMLLTGVPIVTHQRDIYQPNYFHAGISLARQIIAVSEHAKASLPLHLHSKVTVIPNAVSFPEAMPDRRGKAGALRIGVAGRCVPEKGQDLLLDAALSLLSEFDFEVHIWGIREAPVDEFSKALREKVYAAGPKAVDRVFFEPLRSDIETFLTGMDIIVVPSRGPEGFGRVAAEAMGFRRAVIAAGHTGLLNVVTHESTGLLFSPISADGLAQQLRRLLLDESLRHRLADSGRAEAGRRFSPSIHADAVLEIYLKSLRNKS